MSCPRGGWRVRLRAAAGAALVAWPVLAGATPPPSPANSTAPNCFSLVGSLGASPAAAGEFTVICRDLANTPMPGAVVVIDLSGCPDLTLCADQLDPAAPSPCSGAARFS